MAEVRIGVNVDANGAIKSFKLLSSGAKEADKDASGLGKTLQKELSSKVEGMAGRLGPFGNILRSLGPAGLAAAAGIGAVAAAGVLAIRALANLAGEAERIANKSLITGFSQSSIQSLERLAKNASTSSEAVFGAISKMQKAAVDGSPGFTKLGLAAGEFLKRAPEGQLQAVAEKIMMMPTAAERAAAAMGLFGRTGADLLPVLAEVAANGSRDIVAMSDSQIASLKAVDDSLDSLSGAWTDFANQVTAAAAGAAPTGFLDVLSEQLSGLAAIARDGGLLKMLGYLGAIAGGGGVGAMAQVAIAGAAAKAPKGASFPLPALSFPGLPFTQAASTEPFRMQGLLTPAQSKGLEMIEKEAEARQKLIDTMKNERPVDFRAASHPGMGGLVGGGIATSLNLSENRVTVGGEATNLMGALMGLGPATSLVIGYYEEFAMATKARAEAEEAAAQKTRDTISAFGTLSSQLDNLARSVGGLAGTILKTLSALSSGAGGVVSGVDAWKSSGGGLLGILGKASAGLGIAGSVVGAVGGLIGGIKSLFGGKSREEKAAEEQARRQAEADRKAAAEEQKRLKIAGLESAQTGATSLMDRMAEGLFGDKLTGILGTIAGKVQDALLKAGLGYMATGALRESKGFMAAQGAGADIAQVLAGMRQGGALDTGLLAATAAAAPELMEQARAAAEAAGLAPAEATKAGFGAIAPLLREQLNASLASGTELDANTKALIEEAKKNGIEIVADPMVQSLAVQKEIRDILKGDRSGGAGGDPTGRRPDRYTETQMENYSSAGGLGTFIPARVPRDGVLRFHAGEGLLVIPKNLMALSSAGGLGTRAARGADEEDERRRRGPGSGDGGGLPAPSPTSGSPSSSTSTSAALDEVLREIRNQPRGEPVTQIFQPTFKLDPLQTKESREDLGRVLTEHFLRDLRNNPTVQYAVQRAAGTR